MKNYCLDPLKKFNYINMTIANGSHNRQSEQKSTLNRPEVNLWAILSYVPISIRIVYNFISKLDQFRFHVLAVCGVECLAGVYGCNQICVSVTQVNRWEIPVLPITPVQLNVIVNVDSKVGQTFFVISFRFLTLLNTCLMLQNLKQVGATYD